ncbi:MAG: bifunctional DNA-binding transcriptional regulator/O6-methylguanine-DNA methyltransferase Ada [Thermomicrobiales bacterium]
MSLTIADHPPMTALQTDDERWQAVLERDRARDGEFVTAVLTTGIYCRPSCPARHPFRQNVRFYDDPQGAERAGFRPCLRCRPREVSAQRQLAQAAREWLDAHPAERTNLTELAEAMGVSTSHLQRTFTREIGVSPRAYQASLRLETAKRQLRDGAGVTQALYDAGYGSSSRFYEQAGAELGMLPASYRKGGAGVTIAYVIEPMAGGSLLLAATDRGVCAATLGDDVGELEAALRAEFPLAEIRRDAGSEHPVLAATVEQLRRGSGAVAPLDVAGTPFQRNVWAALRAIPAGDTRSYGDVAAALGQPGAVRAVASACAANPVAVLIPCHRVVRADGESGGYRWGAERKRALLAAERRSRIPA